MQYSEINLSSHVVTRIHCYNLSPSAYHCWLWLTLRAQEEGKNTLVISYKKIAQHIRKCHRTVFRAIKELTEKQLLSISKNYREDGGRHCNTLVLVPLVESFIEENK